MGATANPRATAANAAVEANSNLRERSAAKQAFPLGLIFLPLTVQRRRTRDSFYFWNKTLRQHRGQIEHASDHQLKSTQVTHNYRNSSNCGRFSVLEW